MDLITAVGAALLLAGLAVLLLLYRRPASRPLAWSGYTAAAATLIFLAVAGTIGAIALPARGSSEIVVAAMHGVVEGFYMNSSVLDVNTLGGSLEGLAEPAIKSLEAASSATLGGGRCPPEAYPTALIHVLLAKSVTYGGRPLPAPVLEAYIMVDPRLEPGVAYYTHAGPEGNASVAARLEEAGLRVRGSLRGSGDPVLERLSIQCGGPVECLTKASRAETYFSVETPSGPAGPAYEAVGGFAEVNPPRTLDYVELTVSPSGLGAALQAVESAANASRAGSNLTVLEAETYSIIIADLPDHCYGRVTPRAAYSFVAARLSEAAPPGYVLNLFSHTYSRLSGVSELDDMVTAGSMLSLVIVVSVVVAAASPLAASGAVSLARSVALLRLRGYTLSGIKRQLALISAAALLAGGAAGLLAADRLSGGLRAYAGDFGIYAAAGLALATLFIMYRRAHREAASVYVEAVARGSPLASLPPRPPEGLGKMGWLGLALGVYHTIRGYLGFTTAEYLSRNWMKLSNLNPAIQALLAIWAFLEMLTAPFAPALLAYGSARLLAWKAPSIASSRAVRALLGRAAPAAQGMARLVSGRAVALVILTVLATGLAAASMLAGPAASGWASRAAEAAVSPGLLGVKPVEAGPTVTLNYTYTYTGPNGSRIAQNETVNITLYDVGSAVEEARSTCPGGIVAVGLPAVRAFFAYEKTGGGVQEGYILDKYRASFARGAPGLRLLLIFRDANEALELFQSAGVELSPGQVEALRTPGRSLLYPMPATSSGSEGGLGFWVLDGSTRRVERIPNEAWVGVELAPGAEIVRWYANLTGAAGAGLASRRVYIMGSWAFQYADRLVGYPADSSARPVVAVYTLDGSCRSALEGAGFHVYSPRDLDASRAFRRASEMLEAAHPSSFLVPAAIASAALALASAALLAVDADREVRPFMALLRLRGASRGDGLRVSLALWGAFLASSVAIGLLAGLGVALGALNLVTGAAGSEFTYRVTVTLPDGVPVSVAFTGSQARAIGWSWASLAVPAALGLALLAPLLAVSLRVFRRPVAEWVR